MDIKIDKLDKDTKYKCWDCTKKAEYILEGEFGFLQLCDKHFKKHDSPTVKEAYNKLEKS